MSQKDKNPMYFDAGATQARSTARKQLFLNRILSKFTDFSRRGSRNQPTDSLDEDIIQFESFPGSPEAHHPSDIINSYMLYANPDALFAITHDDEWCSVIEESDDAFPEDLELLQRILGKYRPVQDGGCVTLVQKYDHATVVDSPKAIIHQSIRSSSETECAPQASSLAKAPRDTDLRHLPEASLTVDQKQGPPTTVRPIDVADSESHVIGAAHEGVEEKIISLRVIGPHRRELDIRLPESKLVEDLIVAANANGKNAHPYYRGEKMRVGHRLSEYQLSDGAHIEMRIERSSLKTITYLKRSIGLNDDGSRQSNVGGKKAYDMTAKTHEHV